MSTVRSVPLPASGDGVDGDATRAFVATTQGLVTIDRAVNPPVILGGPAGGARHRVLLVPGTDTVVTTIFRAGFQTWDVSNPAQPVQLFQQSESYAALALAPVDDPGVGALARGTGPGIAVTDEALIRIYSLGNPSLPVPLGAVQGFGADWHALSGWTGTSGRRYLTAAGAQGADFTNFDVTLPYSPPHLAPPVPLPGTPADGDYCDLGSTVYVNAGFGEVRAIVAIDPTDPQPCPDPVDTGVQHVAAASGAGFGGIIAALQPGPRARSTFMTPSRRADRRWTWTCGAPARFSGRPTTP
jgi:hypothetical protein